MKAPESPDRLSWSSGMPSITNSLTAWTMPVYEMDDDSTLGETSSGGFTLQTESPRPRRTRCWLVTCMCVWLVVCGGASIALVIALQRTPSVPTAPTPTTTPITLTTSILRVRNQCQDAIEIYYSLDARDNHTMVNANALIALSGENLASVSLRLGASTNATRFVWQRDQAQLASYSITTTDGFNTGMSVAPSEPSACAAVTCLAPLCLTTAVPCPSTTPLEIIFCPVSA